MVGTAAMVVGEADSGRITGHTITHIPTMVDTMGSVVPRTMPHFQRLISIP